MMQALGFVEISGVTAAVDALDIMCKSADVEFVTWERKLGGRLPRARRLDLRAQILVHRSAFRRQEETALARRFF